MSCANHTIASPFAIAAPSQSRLGRPPFTRAAITLIAAFIDAVEEAQAMRRALRKRYPFADL